MAGDEMDGFRKGTGAAYPLQLRREATAAFMSTGAAFQKTAAGLDVKRTRRLSAQRRRLTSESGNRNGIGFQKRPRIRMLGMGEEFIHGGFCRHASPTSPAPSLLKVARFSIFPNRNDVVCGEEPSP